MNSLDYSKICEECGGKCCKVKYAMASLKFDKDADHYHQVRETKHIDTPAGRVYFNELPCQYLTEDNKCSIYEDRPQVCKNFPFSKTSEGDLSAWKYVCPLYAHIVERNKTKGFRIL
jgi:Fe-S-cluster containining protein